MTVKKVIPIYQPDLSGNEKRYVNECLDSNWISSKGEFIERFENSFCEYLNIEYATSVSNGTVALHLALLALGVGPGDEVIVPTLTYIASVNAIAMVGAKPVFVDSLNNTWNLDPSQLEGKINSKTKAIMAVHLYGSSCNMDELLKLCRKNKLFLIEDSAEAFGTKYKGKSAGSFGDVSTFSFFGNKTITTGEGGMVASNNKDIIEKISHLKSQAVSKNREYWHNELGYNYRMTNICAAIGLAQLEKADEILEKKSFLADLYYQELYDCPLDFQSLPEDTVSSFWMVSICLENIETRDRIREHLKRSFIETRPIFYPAHTMPFFKNNEQYVVAESIASRGINLPSFPGLKKHQLKSICDEIKLSLINNS